MRIKKVSQTTASGAQSVNTYSESTENTYSCDYVNKLNTYSTDEIRIGTWMGKPLYRKVASFNVSSDSQQVLRVNVENVDVIIEGKFILKGSDFCAIDHTHIDSSNNHISKWVFTIHSTDVSTTISKTIENGGIYYVILEYTKTTD